MIIPITIPMTVSTSRQVIPMAVSASRQVIPMSLGAAYITIAGEEYTGPYEVTPKAWVDQTLETEGLLMTDDVTVFKVPYYETSNLFDGKTVYIAEEV